MVAIEILTIGKHHPGKAHRLVLNSKEFRNAAHQVLLEAHLLGKIIATVDDVRHIKPAQKIVVFFWHCPELRVGREVLQVGFHERRSVLEERDQRVLALDDLVHYLINADRSARCRCSLRCQDDSRSGRNRLHSGRLCGGLGGRGSLLRARAQSHQ